jgi:hypothetical protein
LTGPGWISGEQRASGRREPGYRLEEVFKDLIRELKGYRGVPAQASAVGNKKLCATEKMKLILFILTSWGAATLFSAVHLLVTRRWIVWASSGSPSAVMFLLCYSPAAIVAGVTVFLLLI